ncbi:MAG: hypothetical protein HWD58_03380 [Bacteroidota bacterium]|nr:MAG: hypothetical protein HWD58_03380 [Bacteroidota bacterium]
MIAPKFKQAYPFHHRRAVVQLGNKQYLITRRGKIKKEIEEEDDDEIKNNRKTANFKERINSIRTACTNPVYPFAYRTISLTINVFRFKHPFWNCDYHFCQLPLANHDSPKYAGYFTSIFIHRMSLCIRRRTTY